MTKQFNPIDNKYTRLYFRIISNRSVNPAVGYTENHHIHPESLGGLNVDENMVRLTAREHFICHLLLTKMLVGDAKKRMHYAFYSMTRKKETMERYVPNSHIYEIYRKNIDRTPSEETRQKMRDSSKTRPPITRETKQKISDAVVASYTPELIAKRVKQFKNQIFTKEHRSKLSAAKLGTIRTKESKKKQAASITGELNHKSREWTVMSPSGEIFKTKAMNQFCDDQGINYFSMRNRAYHKDIRPISRGTAKGWVVLNY